MTDVSLLRVCEIFCAQPVYQFWREKWGRFRGAPAPYFEKDPCLLIFYLFFALFHVKTSLHLLHMFTRMLSRFFGYKNGYFAAAVVCTFQRQNGLCGLFSHILYFQRWLKNERVIPGHQLLPAFWKGLETGNNRFPFFCYHNKNVM